MDFDIFVNVVVDIDVVGKNEDSSEIDWFLFMFHRIKNRDDSNDRDDRENRHRDSIDCCCCCGDVDGGNVDDGNVDDSNE